MVWLRRLCRGMERFRRTQLRGGSFYTSVRAVVPLCAMWMVWLALARWKGFSSLQVLLSQTEGMRRVLPGSTVTGLWLLWLGLSRYERRSPLRETLAEVTRLILAALACGVLMFLWGATGRSVLHGLEVASLGFTGLLSLALLNLGAFVAAAMLSPRVLRKRIAVVVGTGPRAAMLRSNVMRYSPDIEIFGHVDRSDYGEPETPRGSYLGDIRLLPELLKKHPIELVLIALPMRSKYDDIQGIVATCEQVGVESHYLHDIFETERFRVHPHGEAPEYLSVLGVFTPRSKRFVKRLMDLVCASILLVLSAPIMLAAAIAIRLEGPGPIFFRQYRYGCHRKLFPMFKFRSMVENAEKIQAALEQRNEAQGPVFKLKRDPRVTRSGAFLRRTSIDELPQLFNVLRGEMSLVGPRPLPQRDVSRFEEPWLLRRFSVRPGLTCIWQVNGRSNTSFDDWIKQDLDYIDRWSIAMDVSILVRTIPAVLRGSGAM